jgi:hypothetical protein
MKIRADVFPAVATLADAGSLEDINELLPRGGAPKGSRKVDACRITLIDGLILIAVDSPTGPRLVFKEKVESYSKEEKIHRVKTETGKFIAFGKDNNCGCGSRLRTWNPYKNILTSQENPEK